MKNNFNIRTYLISLILVSALATTGCGSGGSSASTPTDQTADASDTSGQNQVPVNIQSESLNFEVVYSFGSKENDGANPKSGLVAVNGMLYGTTNYGGSNNYGTVYTIDPTTGTEEIVHSFLSYTTDGAIPSGTLLFYGNEILGTTENGGSHQIGTVYSIDPTTGFESVVVNFTDLGSGNYPGVYPLEGLTAFQGELYGTTKQGGGTAGLVFSLDPNTYSENNIYSFNNAKDETGTTPDSILLAYGNKLYGTTLTGGVANDNCMARGCGLVYSIDFESSIPEFKVVHEFTGYPDGGSPQGGLILNPNDGKLYDTTFRGGESKTCVDLYQPGYGCGTIYSIDPNNNDAESVVHVFKEGADGTNPNAALVFSPDNKLYGTTTAGGNKSYGTIFSFDPSSNIETVVYSFTGGVDGANPQSQLLPVTNDNTVFLYGATFSGGESGVGTVFRLGL